MFASPGVNAESATERVASEVRDYLAAHAARLSDAGAPLETIASEGEAAGGILDAITACKPGLVMMTAHGRSAVGWLFGTTAAEVLRRSPVPVQLMRAEVESPWPAERPTIVVPLDGSEMAEVAMDPASELSSQLAAQLVLVQVVSPPPSATEVRGLGPVAVDPGAPEWRARAYLTDVARRLGSAARRIHIRVEVGYTAQSIARVAAEARADLICIASHWPADQTRAALGNVGTGLLRVTAVPLVVLRPEKTLDPPPAGHVTPTDEVDGSDRFASGWIVAT